MADISMCTYSDCPKKFSCYRYMALNSPYQTVTDFPDKGEGCSHFWALENNQIRVTEEWIRKGVVDYTPDQEKLQEIGMFGGEEIVARLNYQRLRVLKVSCELSKQTILKIKKQFFLTKVCTNKKGNQVLKTTLSPLKQDFYIITNKQLLVNPSQKVAVRIGIDDVYQ